MLCQYTASQSRRCDGFGLCELADLLDECECLAEVLEPEGPLDAVCLVDEQPIGCLDKQGLCLLPRQGRDAAPARGVSLLGQDFRHDASINEVACSGG